MNSKNPQDVRIPLERTGGGSILEKGVYCLRVEKVEVKNGPSGSPYLNFTMIVLGDNGKPTANRIWDVISLGEKSRFMMDQFLDAVGAATEGKISPNWFMRRKVWASLTQEEYKGTLKNTVEKYLIPDMAQKLLEEAGGSDTEEAQIRLAFSEDDEDEEESEEVSVVKNVPSELADGDDVPF